MVRWIIKLSLFNVILPRFPFMLCLCGIFMSCKARVLGLLAGVSSVDSEIPPPFATQSTMSPSLKNDEIIVCDMKIGVKIVFNRW